MSSLTAVITIILGCAAASAAGYFMIPLLRRIQFGQSVYEEGPVWFKRKNGTPSMGGFICITGLFTAYAAGAAVDRFAASEPMDIHSPVMLIGMIFSVVNAGVGFAEDYYISVKHSRERVPFIYKAAIQIIFASLLLMVLYISGDTSTSVYVPFGGYIDLGVMYYPFTVLFILTVTSAVAANDCTDGICGTETAVFAASWLVMCITEDITEQGIYSAALAGSCLGFLLWNLPFSKITLGKSGAMLLGGCVCAAGITMHQHIILLLAAGVYLPELFIKLYHIIRRRMGKTAGSADSIYELLRKKGFKEYKIIIIYGCAAFITGAAANIIYNLSER